MTGFQIGFGAVALALTLVFSGVWVFQTYGVYRFDPAPQSPEAFGLTGVKVVDFTSEDGVPAQAWLAMPAPGQPVLFSFYGNFAAIGPSMQRLAPLLADGTGIVMLHYRGAGGMAGHPSEEAFAGDARALYDQLDRLAGQIIPSDRRMLHGFSLGSGVAIRLASERAFAGLVLEATIPRLCLYFQRRYHGVPLCHLMWAERYDSIDRISQIATPMLFLHGGKDRDVPLLWGRQLYDASTAPKRFVEVPDGGHADLAKHGLIPEMRDFLGMRVD
jgi:dipeptidyl aminopeptidase/acylaminoacyl peptidase